MRKFYYFFKKRDFSGFEKYFDFMTEYFET